MLITTRMKRMQRNSIHQLAFALDHSKESAMGNSDGTSSASQTTADVKKRVQEAAETVTERGKELAGEAARDGAQRLASTAENTASALRRAAEDVEGENKLIGSALRKSAESIEKVAQSFQGRDLSRAAEDLNGLARRQPAIFLGASMALGFALARLGKTALEQTTDQQPIARPEGAATAMPEI